MEGISVEWRAVYLLVLGTAPTSCPGAGRAGFGQHSRRRWNECDKREGCR